MVRKNVPQRTQPTPRKGKLSPPLPDQHKFRQHLRQLARGAIRVVLEDVMREELDALSSQLLE